MNRPTPSTMVWTLYLIVALGIVASRFAQLEADHPKWMEEAYLVDGGWWSAAAKSGHHFGDPHRIDFGIARYMLPGYSAIAEAFYDTVGEGTPSTRLLSCIASLGTIILAAGWVAVRHGLAASVLAAVLLGSSPLFWAHGRSELPTGLLTLPIFAAVTLLALAPGRRAAVACAGTLLALAFSIKPTGVALGILPTFGAVTLAVLANRRWPSKPFGAALSLRTLIWLGIGFAAAMALFYALVVLPDPERYRAAWTDVTGQYSSGLRAWFDKAGKLFTSKTLIEAGWHGVVWRILTHSPALFLGAWIFALRAARSGAVDERQASPAPTRFAALWVVAFGVCMPLCPTYPDYRWLPMLPVLTILAISALTAPDPAPGPSAATSRLRTYVNLALLTLPVYLVAKAPVANLLSEWLVFLRPAESSGTGQISVFSAGAAFTVVWLAALAALGFTRYANWSIPLPGRRSLAVLCGIALLLEFGLVIGYLASPSYGLRNAQRTLAALPANSSIGGVTAATLLTGTNHLPVRRTHPAQTPKAADAPEWGDRLPSRFLVIAIMNHAPWRHSDNERVFLTARGYRAIDRFEIGAMRDGTPRFAVDLFEKAP